MRNAIGIVAACSNVRFVGFFAARTPATRTRFQAVQNRDLITGSEVRTLSPTRAHPNTIAEGPRSVGASG